MAIYDFSGPCLTLFRTLLTYIFNVFSSDRFQIWHHDCAIAPFARSLPSLVRVSRLCNGSVSPRKSGYWNFNALCYFADVSCVSKDVISMCTFVNSRPPTVSDRLLNCVYTGAWFNSAFAPKTQFQVRLRTLVWKTNWFNMCLRQHAAHVVSNMC